MDPTEQDVPADPSSSQQLPPQQRAVQRPQRQQYTPRAALPLPPQRLPLPQPPPQGLAPTAAHAVQWRPQQFDGVRPYLSMPQPQRYGHASSVAQERSTWSDSFMVFDPSVKQSSSTPSFSASQRQTSASGPQAGATDPFFARGDNVSLDPHAFTLPSGDQVDPQSWGLAPAILRKLTPEEVRALHQVHRLVLGDVGFPCSSARVVRLLKESCEEVRTSVFFGVMRALYFVMGNSKWRVVFVELLQAARFHELRVIVNVACEGQVSLMRVADNEYGVASLEDLFRAVEPHTKLRQELINCLLNEDDLMTHSKGTDLLRGIFTTFPYEDCSIVIQHALKTFRGVVLSAFGSMSMVECFAVAENLDLHRLGEMTLSHTVEFAKGKYSNNFLQEVLERGGDLLKERITVRVVENLVDLSLNQYGTHVVQACFLRTGSRRLPLLQRVLTEFLRLPDEQLAQLVQDHRANYVVRKLLQAGKDEQGFRDETMTLARRIQMLPVAGLEQVDQTVSRVMEVVRKVLS